jgi:hypothetical protein
MKNHHLDDHHDDKKCQPVLQQQEQEQELPTANTTVLPLHTSQSSPILYRNADSFLQRGTNPDQMILRQGHGTTHTETSELSQHPDSQTAGNADIQNKPAASYIYEQEEDDDADDDDTFENHCDIEDQATVERSRSSTSLTSNSFSAMSNKLLNSISTADITTSDYSDDVDIDVSTITYPYNSTSSACSQYKKEKKKSKMRRNDCSVSSIGTYSKYKKNRKRVHIPSRSMKGNTSNAPLASMLVRQERNRMEEADHSISRLIVFFFKIIAGIWISAAITFIFYHLYIYNPSLSTMEKFKFVTGKGYHIPLPPPAHKVSVVLMNHSRPRMIKESTLVPTLLQHPSVEEVVILHSNPKTQFNFIHPKVINIDATKENDQMGLSLRFYFCQLVKSDWVLHVDEDMEFTENTLNEMLLEFAKNTKRIVGRYGRDRKENYHFNGYYSKDAARETEVILTKFMVMERNACSAFFQYSHLIWEDVILNNGEGPLWNGEDIFMSLVANHIYGHDGERNNYAMDWLDVWSAPEELKDYTNGKYDISGGFSGLRFWDFHWWRSLLNRNRHYSYRGKLWKEARDRLQSSGPHVSHEF